MGDTIVACATPFGVGAIAVVRLSGAAVDDVVRAVCGRLPPPRRASVVALRDAAGTFDDAVVTRFVAPASYTGEGVAEISCHGNPLLVGRLLDACVAAGARLALPGEFTRRAVANGRLDLVRAEAVLSTLEATSARGLELARAALDGTLGARIDALRAGVVEVASELEAILDYPGEDLLFRTDAELAGALAALADEASGLAASAPAGVRAVTGARVALVGPVNAGKSTLLNALAGRPRALVSPTPGTTRDVVETTVQLPELRITLLDTAGERATTDAVEAAGLELGREAADEADLRVLVVPLHLAEGPEVAALRWRLRAPTLVVGTHGDLPRRATLAVDVEVCAPRGQGLPALVDALRDRLAAGLDAPVGAPGSATLALTSRHQADLLAAYARSVRGAAEALGVAGPAAAVEHLHAALAPIDALVGRDTREAVLDRLFARFCVGK